MVDRRAARHALWIDDNPSRHSSWWIDVHNMVNMLYLVNSNSKYKIEGDWVGRGYGQNQKSPQHHSRTWSIYVHTGLFGSEFGCSK